MRGTGPALLGLAVLLGCGGDDFSVGDEDAGAIAPVVEIVDLVAIGPRTDFTVVTVDEFSSDAAPPAPDGSSPPSPPPGEPPAPCQAEGDFIESADFANDVIGGGAAEASGLTIGAGGAPLVIGGCVRNIATPWGADTDGYRFTVTSALTAQIAVIWSTPTVPVHWVRLLDVGGSPLSGWGFAATGEAILPASPLPAGSYQVVVEVDNPAPPEPYVYQIVIREAVASCDAVPAAPSYVEADESATGHRSNDVVALTWTPMLFAEDSACLDAAEPTGVMVAPGASLVLAGQAGYVLSDGDNYMDRDAYLVKAGPATTEIDLRLDWTGDPDLDLVVFDADDLGAIRGGGITTGASEAASIRVTPGSSLWVWIGTYDDGPTDLPASYAITICGR